MFPLHVEELAHTVGYALIFMLIGFGFGAALELTGFGNTRKLAAQFYLSDLTVLKTMFTAIVVAAVLVALASSFALLDISRVWVNPTYLWPGIVGGLVMGVGFVVGGFCPGTSLIAAATGKIDGMMFVAGALVGVGVFGETVASFEPFFLSGSMGRFTLPEWLGLSTGTVIALLVLMALSMFLASEALEKRYGSAELRSLAAPRPALRRAGVVALLAVTVLVMVHGQPDADARFAMTPALPKLVEERAMFVSPAEVVSLRQDLSVRADVLDLRSESDFNLFHVSHAERVREADLRDRARLRTMQDAGPSTVTFLVAADEASALAAFRQLRTEGILNLYIIDGGIDRWLDLYPPPSCVASRGLKRGSHWRFHYATGASLPSASPELSMSRSFKVPCREPESTMQEEPALPGEPASGHYSWPNHAFEPRVHLQAKSLVKGGCG